MIDINDALEKIQKKYELNKKYLLKDRIEKYIRRIIQEYTKEYASGSARIIVRGLKNRKQYPLLKIITEYGNVVAVVDKNPITDKVILDNGTVIDVLGLEHSEELECDVYIINSKYSGNSIRYDVMNKGKKYKVVDLYTEMRLRFSVVLTNPYEEYENETDFSHNKVHELYDLFKKEQNEEYLREVLGACLTNRDFITFFEIINEAEDLIAKHSFFLQLRKDVDNLLGKLKEIIRERRKNLKQDIIIHWIDQVGYEELNNFPRLKRTINNGVFFENAYTVTPYTKATETCIFYNDAVSISNRLIAIEVLENKGLEGSRLVSDIRNHGYKIIVTGELVEDFFPEHRNEYIEYMAASSVYYWDMINQLINSDKPVFGVVGSFVETHEPWMSPKCDLKDPCFAFEGNYSTVKNKVKISAEYYDKVLAFYSDIFTDSTISIYMSDHGKWEDIALRRYSDFAMHSILGITNIGMVGKVSRIFSYKYFPNLIVQVMHYADKRTCEHIFGDAEIQSSNFKASIKKRIKETYDNDTAVEEIYSDICSGYSGIKTSIDTYIQIENGKEIYLLAKDNKKINRINEKKYEDRIHMLRNRIMQM